MSGNGILLFLVLWPICGAFGCYLIGRRNKGLRCYAADVVVIVEFFVLVCLFLNGIDLFRSGFSAGAAGNGFRELAFSWEGFGGIGLCLKLDGFRILYGLIAAFSWTMTTIFSKEYLNHYRNRNRYYLFLLWTLGATMGVFLSADFYTTFLFFEVMSFTSYAWIAHDENAAAMRAAHTYLAVAVIGGMVLLMGLFLLYHITGTLKFEELLPRSKAMWSTHSGALYTAGALMLIGFGAKAGMFPLHIWLPKAHPVAPAPASALLSGILTKTGVFGIVAVSCNLFLYDMQWGNLILAIGVATMLTGAILALFSIDLKRTLACSSISQIGFILVGSGLQGILGEENALAVRGTVLHMINHSSIKLVLFLSAGVVYQNLHKLDLNEIRGFGRNKPALSGCFLMGALGISGIPLWNGYISKTLLHESLVEAIHLARGNTIFLYHTVEWLFLLAGGITVAYMLKLFIALCVEAHPSKQTEFEQDYPRYMNRQSLFALIGSAVLLPLFGMLPQLLMDGIADLGQGFFHGRAPLHPVQYFMPVNLKGGIISIMIGIFIYFGIVRTWMMEKREDGTRCYVNRWPVWLDLETLFYRPVFAVLLPRIGTAVCLILDRYLLQSCLTVFLSLSTIVCRTMDHCMDFLIVLARSTTHRQVRRRTKRLNGDRFAYLLGILFDDAVLILNKTICRNKPIRRSYLPRFVELEEELMKTTRLISTSMSFGLMLVCIGLSLTLIYLLL